MADGSVIIDTELDQSGLKTGLAAMAGTVASGITAAIAAAGAALAALGAYAINVGSDFEVAISNVAATMGTTTDQIGDITAKSKELGATTAFSATQAAEGFNILAQSGLAAAEQLSTIDSVLNLAAAGEMTMADAASYVTTTMKAMSIEMDAMGNNASYVADLYAKGATLANTSTSQFGEAMTSAASVAGAYNQSLETTGTALLLLAEKGYQGSAAGTYLSRAMSDLYAPTANASAALAELGVSAYNSAGQQRDFVDVINDLNAAFSTMTEEEKAAYTGTIFTTAGLKAFNSIAENSSEQIATLTDRLVDCTGAAKAMANTKLDNLQGDITILKSATEAFGISVYEHMQLPLRDLVQEGTALMDELNEAVKVGGLSGLAGAVGNVLAQATSKIIEYIPSFASGAADLMSSLVQGLTSNAPRLSSAAASVVQTLTSSFASVATDLVALGGEMVISLCNGLSENAESIFAAASTGLINFGLAITSYLPQVVSAGASLLTALAGGLLSALPELVAAIPEITSTLVSGLSEASGEIIACAAGIIGSLAEALPDLITSLTDCLPELMQLIVDSLTDLAPMLLEAATQAVVSIADALPEIIGSIISVLPTLVQSIADGILTMLPTISQAGVTLLTSLVSSLPQIITTICLALPSLVSSITSTLLGMVPQIVTCGVQLLVSLVQALPDIIYEIVSVLPLIITSMVATLAACAPEIVQCGIELLTSLIAALPQIIITIVAALPAIVMSIVAALIDSIPLIIQCGVELLTSLIAALPEIITAIVAAIPTIISSLVSAIVSNVGVIAQAGIQLLTSLILALPQIIASLVQAAPQIVTALVSAIVSLGGEMVSAGRNLLLGLGDGIAAAVGAVVAKAKAAAAKIVSTVKGYFGIASPSKLFRDEIGNMLMLGLADGIAEEAMAAISATEEAAQKISDVDFSIDGPKFDDDDFDYDDIIINAQNVVRQKNASTSEAVSADATEEIYRSSNRADPPAERTNGSDEKPKYIVNNIDIDGKRTARVITPYIAEELEWEGK